MGFASTSLPISKNSAIVALQNVLDDRRCGILVDFKLTGGLIIGRIKGELFWRLIRVGLSHVDLSLFCALDHCSVALLLFTRGQRSASDHDAHRLVLLRKRDIRVLSFLHYLNLAPFTSIA